MSQMTFRSDGWDSLVKKVSWRSSVSDERVLIFLSNREAPLAHPHWYKLPLDMYSNGNLGWEPTHSSENDVHDLIFLYKETIRQDKIDYGDPNINVRAQNEHKLNVAEQVETYKKGNVTKIACIDKREEECCKWITYHRSVH